MALSGRERCISSLKVLYDPAADKIPTVGMMVNYFINSISKCPWITIKLKEEFHNLFKHELIGNRMEKWDRFDLSVFFFKEP